MRGYQDPVLAEGTERLLAEARARAAAGERVRVVSLPSLRDHLLIRLAAEGPRLGVEVAHFQALYLEALAAEDPPQGLMGTGERLARVAELLFRRDWLGSPGLARLFAKGIAELKRFGIAPEEVPAPDGETRRLQAVYADYERAKGKRLDPDDVAWEAVRRAEAGRLFLPDDALFALGFFELSPREVRFLRALDGAKDVAVVLPEDPGLGLAPIEPRPVRVHLLRAANPVHELRYVLAEVKADLMHRGLDPGELAIVAPEGKLAEIELLAREYGLPLANEAYRALAETEDGRRLVEKLSFIRQPTGERLFLFPGFEELARAALKLGLVGWDALLRLAEAEGQREQLEALSASLTPGEDPLSWAEELIESDPQLRRSAFRDLFLQRAREAFLAGEGREFVAWWLGFLESVRARRREPAGVALLTPDAALGRRYAKAYLVYAVAGQWRVGEREDYFFPEELRRAWPALFAEGAVGLPQRLRGRDEVFWQGLRALAEEVVISFPDTEGGQPLRPEAGLVVGLKARGMPRPRPASTLRFRPRRPRSERYPPLHPPRHLAELERWDRAARCGFKAWMSRLALPGVWEEPWALEDWRAVWWRLVQAAKDGKTPPEEALAAFAMRTGEWRAIQFWRRVGLSFLPVPAVVGGLWRVGRQVRVLAFHGEPVRDTREAQGVARNHLNEILAAAALAKKQPTEVWVWGMGGRPVQAYTMRMENVRIRTLVENRVKRAKELLSAWREAVAEPVPGWHCRHCPFGDVCRRG